ncbi:MAG: alpha/beta hydrolase [Micrococcales bacterium]|nr:MAG: alpha/beta hydrolase [Micrococcales bacterium]
MSAEKPIVDQPGVGAAAPQAGGSVPAEDRYRRWSVDTPDGSLTVGEWVPVGEPDPELPALVAIHGITANHRCWPYLAAALPGTRLIAPDLRGRGGSHEVGPPFGMAAHADDVSRVIEAAQLESVTVLGQSMGGFVAVVTADRHPDQVERLVLVDGGLPLGPPPEDLAHTMPRAEVEKVLTHITGPIRARLSMEFDDEESMLSFWQKHPALQDAWDAVTVDFACYDVGDLEHLPLSSRVSIAAMEADSADLLTASTIGEALQRLRHPASFVTVPRGLQNETPGMYPPAIVQQWRDRFPDLVVHELDDFNHYTIVLTAEGSAQMAAIAKAG